MQEVSHTTVINWRLIMPRKGSLIPVAVFLSLGLCTYAQAQDTSSFEHLFGSHGVKHQAEYCSHYVKEPESELAEGVQEFGWHIVDQVKFGPYTMISVASALTNTTGGACKSVDGRLFIFDDSHMLEDKVIVLKSDHPDATTSKHTNEPLFGGRLELLEGGKVRVWSGNFYSWPMGDIDFAKDEIQLGPVSKLTTYCAGEAVVPSLVNTGLLEAVPIIKSYGWSNNPDAPGDTMRSFEGVTPEYCMPTGVAYCRFEFLQNDNRLVVITGGEGDNPGVSNLRVECGS